MKREPTSFHETIAAFRATADKPSLVKRAHFTGRREQRALALSGSATYAIPQPRLCDEMPHRFFPVRESDAICIRCGLMEGRL